MLSNAVEAERVYLFVQHLGRRLREIDAREGLTAARYSALASLRFHGSTNIGELATDERVRAPSMTRLVRDMERDGLVRRLPDPDDGRGVLIVLTSKGKALFDHTRAAKIALVADYMATLSEDVRRAAATAFRALEDLAEPADEASVP